MTGIYYYNFLFPLEPLKGPLALLQDCHTHQIPVQILTRHSRGLRGVIRGNIIAFDRHFNMVRDVQYVYCIR